MKKLIKLFIKIKRKLNEWQKPLVMLILSLIGIRLTLGIGAWTLSHDNEGFFMFLLFIISIASTFGFFMSIVFYGVLTVGNIEKAIKPYLKNCYKQALEELEDEKN